MEFLNKYTKPEINYLHSSKHISFLITAKKKLAFIPFGSSNNQMVSDIALVKIAAAIDTTREFLKVNFNWCAS